MRLPSVVVVIMVLIVPLLIRQSLLVAPMMRLDQLGCAHETGVIKGHHSQARRHFKGFRKVGVIVWQARVISGGRRSDSQVSR